MLTKNNLQELLDYQALHPVLSVYLNTDPALGSADVYKLKLRSMLKKAEAAEEDVNEVERYFEGEYDWAGRSVAIFSCQAEDFFRAYPLAMPMRSRVRINFTSPHVKPLVNLLNHYGHYGVAVIDQQGARLFSFHMGALREQEGVLGDDIQRIKDGFGSQAGGRRGGKARQVQPKETAERNMKEAAEFATKFFSEQNVRRVLIGGTEDNSAQFRSYLPKSWQSLIVGTFAISMTAGHMEVLDKALEVGRSAEHERENLLIDELVTSAAKGQDGALGLDDTFSAVQQGRVQTLVIREGFGAPGFHCQNCGNLTTTASEACPLCNGEFVKIADVVELAVQLVLRAGGEVEFVEESETLREHGEIGATLRY